jgi:hypothetical protein
VEAWKYSVIKYHLSEICAFFILSWPEKFNVKYAWLKSSCSAFCGIGPYTENVRDCQNVVTALRGLLLSLSGGWSPNAITAS